MGVLCCVCVCVLRSGTQDPHPRPSIQRTLLCRGRNARAGRRRRLAVAVCCLAICTAVGPGKERRHQRLHAAPLIVAQQQPVLHRHMICGGCSMVSRGGGRGGGGSRRNQWCRIGGSKWQHSTVVELCGGSRVCADWHERPQSKHHTLGPARSTSQTDRQPSPQRDVCLSNSTQTKTDTDTNTERQFTLAFEQMPVEQ